MSTNLPEDATEPRASGIRPWLSEDRVDVVELVLLLWSRKLVIAVSSLGMFLLALVASFVLAKEYKSVILLLPTETPKLDQLGAAAALLGKKATSGSVDLELYQTLLTSRAVTSRLLLSSIPNRSDSAKGREEPLFRILRIDTSDPGSVMAAQIRLAKSFEVTTVGSGMGNIIQVTAKAQEAWLAQSLADTLVSLGQEAIRRIRIERSQTILSRLVAASEVAKGEWDEAARNAADFRGVNRSIVLPDQQYRLDQLMMEKQLKEQKYTMARREVEQLVLEQEKAAPPAMVLDAATLPARPSKPNRPVLLVLGLVLGAGAGCAGIAAWSLLRPRFRRI